MATAPVRGHPSRRRASARLLRMTERAFYRRYLANEKSPPERRAFVVSCPGRGAAFFMPLRRAGTVPDTMSYAGLTRVSIALQKTLPSKMDGWVKPGHDEFLAAQPPTSALITSPNSSHFSPLNFIS